MTTNHLSQIVQQLRRAVLLQDGAGLTDGQLLGSFIENRDEAAFAALVKRHSPMVWGVCRRVLGNYHDAEDACQATFLVLVRKAASIASKDLLANWLYGVAHQTALKARATVAKRRAKETQVTGMPEPAVTEGGKGTQTNCIREKVRVPFFLFFLSVREMVRVPFFLPTHSILPARSESSAACCIKICS